MGSCYIMNLFDFELNAGEKMAKFIAEGNYRKIKQIKHDCKSINTILNQHLTNHEGRRFEYEKYNLVAKYVKKNIYEMDYVGLNEYLNDLGILQDIAKIDSSVVNKDEDLYKMLLPYVLEQTYCLVPAFNKTGRALTSIKEADYSNYEIEDCLKEMVLKKRSKENWLEIYEQFIDELSSCPELIEKRKLTHSYGSIYFKKNKLQYDSKGIYDELGSEILIEHAKIDSIQLDTYISRGFLNPKDIEQFRKVVDVKVDFVLMELDKERNILSMMNRKRQIAALNQTFA